MSISKFINKPYPCNANIGRKILIFGVISPLILILFQPFGLHYFQTEYKILILIGYGVIAIIIETLFYFLTKWLLRFINEENWKIYKQFLLQMLILLVEAVPMYFYSVAYTDFGNRFTGSFSFFLLIGFVFIVASIPFSITILLTHNKLLKQNLKIALEMNRKISHTHASANNDRDITFLSNNISEKITVKASDLICIAVDRNYIIITYKHGQKINTEQIRCTLVYCEQQTNGFDMFFKCHRAFIVNLLFVDNIIGNAQGYRLEIPEINTPIPVSRNYIKEFKVKMDFFQK